MTINGIDVQTAFGVKEWNIEPSYAAFSNKSEWIAGAVLPDLMKAETGLKTQKVKVMIKGRTREEMWDKAGQLISALLKPCIVQFRHFEDRYFKCVLVNASHAEVSLRRFHTATLELTGYEYGIERSFTSTDSTMKLYNIGSARTPCIISVTPSNALNSLNITGVLRDPFKDTAETLTISNLRSGREIIIDPFAGTVLEGSTNRFDDVSMNEWPSLIPGENTITVNQSGVTLKVTFAPFYL